MERLIKVLIDLLVSKGMELTSIPAFIRNLGNTLATDPYMTLEELSRHIQLLGWDDFELDLCTLQLVLATFEFDFSPQSTRGVSENSVQAELPELAGKKEGLLAFHIDHSKVMHIG